MPLGALSLVWYAIVGPPAKDVWSILDSTYQKLRSVANQQAGTAFAVAAADIAVGNQIEGLLAGIVNAFGDRVESQRWITDSGQSGLVLRLSDSSDKGDGFGAVLQDNIRTAIIVFPEQSNPGDQRQIQAMIKGGALKGATFDSNGRISYSNILLPYMSGGTTAGKFRINGDGAVERTDQPTANPFDFIPYLTIWLTASSSTVANPSGG